MRQLTTKIILFILVLATAGLSIGTPFGALAQRPSPQPQGKQTVVRSEMEGTVEVSFKIDGTGRVKILEMNATSQALADYVIKKLSKIQLSEEDYADGQVIKYRFVFKKQA
jgi:hypothetical protein